MEEETYGTLGAAIFVYASIFVYIGVAIFVLAQPAQTSPDSADQPAQTGTHSKRG